MAAAEEEGLDPAAEMILFVEELGAAGRAVTSDFLVVAQNAPYLLDHDPDRYAAAIDGLAVEDTWFRGAGEADWEDPLAGDIPNDDEGLFSTESRLEQSAEYLARSLPVFSVDYCVSSENAASVYARAGAAGLRPLVTRVSLSRPDRNSAPRIGRGRSGRSTRSRLTPAARPYNLQNRSMNRFPAINGPVRVFFLVVLLLGLVPLGSGRAGQSQTLTIPQPRPPAVKAPEPPRVKPPAPPQGADQAEGEEALPPVLSAGEPLAPELLTRIAEGAVRGRLQPSGQGLPHP